jgi:hypothetical protein
MSNLPNTKAKHHWDHSCWYLDFGDALTDMGLRIYWFIKILVREEAERLKRGNVVRLTLGFKDGAIESTAPQA